MTLVQLHYFRAVCAHKNITRAARELHISQPSLSKAIRDLEGELGLSLFYRLHTGLVLTEEGAQLLEAAEALLREEDAFLERARALCGRDQTVRLGVPPMLSALVFPQLLQGFRDSFPQAGLQVVEKGTVSNRKLVLEGALDAAIVSHEPPDAPDLGSHCLGAAEICCYVSARHPLAGREKVSLPDLEAVPLVLLGEDAFLTGFLLERFRALGIEPQVLLHTNQLATIAQLVGRGVAASFLFDHVLPPEREIAKLPVAGLPRIRIYLIWNARRPLSPGTKNLIRLARLLYPAPPREEAEEGRP